MDFTGSGGGSQGGAALSWKHWKRVDGRIWDAPYDGAIPGTQRFISLEPGGPSSPNIVDRYGLTSGTYVAPAGTSLESRALSYAPNSPLHAYVIYSVIDNVERSTVAPWFGKKGLGPQYKLPDSVQYHLEIRKLRENK